MTDTPSTADAITFLANMVPTPSTEEEAFKNAKDMAGNIASKFLKTTKVVITIGEETREYHAVINLENSQVR
jgi:hypothetical protein